MKVEYDLSKLKARRNPYASKLSERPWPVGTSVKDNRRAQLRAAAARVRESLSAEFQQLGAEEIMNFIRGDEPAQDPKRRGNR